MYVSSLAIVLGADPHLPEGVYETTMLSPGDGLAFLRDHVIVES
jgi:hypothetical protein